MFLHDGISKINRKIDAMSLQDRTEIAYKVICFGICIAFSVWQIAEYIYSDDDAVRLEFTKFHSSEDRAYPSLTICFNVSKSEQLYLGLSQRTGRAIDTPNKASNSASLVAAIHKIVLRQLSCLLLLPSRIPL